MESNMEEALELIDLGDAKEVTNGWRTHLPSDEAPGMPFGRDET